jgi:uroporphyrin-III C-methyltransferase/precorrin-2 dehydrogenase/sirohydrochlorin ferrochelatase
MRSLPLFHAITGKPVIVLGEGAMAEPKRRLIERAGGEVIDSLEAGLERGARLAFVALDDPAEAAAAADRLKAAGLLVNVVDQPDLCDFTTPSILDRDPLLIAVGTGGASAGLAKQVRLRLETLLPSSLGQLALALQSARAGLRARWPDGAARRRGLDEALAAGGALDPLVSGSAAAVGRWLAGAGDMADADRVIVHLTSDDPDDLTLYQARMLGIADVVLHDPAVPAAILDRARADALRQVMPFAGDLPPGIVVELRRE